MDKKNIPIVIISGPTGSGKTDIAVELAEKFNGEIISADSMQVYKYVDIASAKPDNNQLKKIKHYLISEKDLTAEFSAYDFVYFAGKYITEITAKNKIVFIVGGTGLYIRSLIYGISEAPGKDENIRKKLNERIKKEGLNSLYDELKSVDKKYADKISKNDPVRIIRALEVFYMTKKPFSYFMDKHTKTKLYNPLWLAVDTDRKILYERINNRILKMFDDGLIKETKKILEIRNKNNTIIKKVIGYMEIQKYLNGEKKLGETIEEIKKRTRHYAKRQITWFKKEKDIIWVSLKNKKNIYRLVEEYLNSFTD